MAKQDYERIGGGRYDIYRPKKKSFWESAGEVIGGLIAFVVGLALIGAIFG